MGAVRPSGTSADAVALARKRARLHPPGELDPVTAEVVRTSMETVCFEMATYVSRTATTPILNQSNERNATILDRNGRLAALSVGIPQFMLTSTLPVRFALEFFEADEWRDGDVFVSNDPYHGGGHLPDYNVYAPVVIDGELVCIASIQCHHGDTGGSSPGGYNVNATEIWAEGVRWPAVKVVDEGVERRDLLYAMASNVRLPGFVGDIRAQIGAAQLGARRLKGIVERHGRETVERSMDFAIEYAAQRFREAVASWPDGTYAADVYVDHDPLGHPDIHLHCEVTVAGDELTVDFNGTDTRDEIQAWSTFGNTRGYVIAQLASLVDPEVPKNEGFFDNVELIVPEGCVLNPRAPKPVSAGSHHPGTEVGEVVALALAQAIPDRSAPQIYKLGIPIIFAGLDKDGNRFIDHGGEVFGAWVQAVKGQDGWGSKNAAFGNLFKAPAELHETSTPHLLWGRDFITDSGGPGQWRGGCGSRYIKETLVPAQVHTYVVGKKYPMPGIAGGRNGAPNRLTIKVGSEQPIEVDFTAEWVPHEAGEKVVYEFGGGGGWGDPLDREPQAVLDDVLDEYVSVEAAARDYGVVLTGSLEELTLAVDEPATERLRTDLRASRSDAEPRT
ncbi:MAG: hydantoinase B/oxoprolinase family protein [Actinobacteria bacterium]|nr:hydantoinase B/oxoprolinase family protein [Actinomycetota bacterium]